MSSRRNSRSASGQNSTASTGARHTVIDALSPLFGRVPISTSSHPASGSSNGWGIIRVSVANLRFEPNHRAELGTQCLLGNVIRILTRRSTWSYAQTADGYRGWIEAGHFVPCERSSADAWATDHLIFVTERVDRIQEKPNANALHVSDVVAGCLLKTIGIVGDYYRVELPDQRVGYLPRTSGMDYTNCRAVSSMCSREGDVFFRHLA